MKKKLKNKQKKVSSGREYVVISYLFVLIFLSLIAYMIYFNTVLVESYSTSSFNKRSAAKEEHVVRGQIFDAKGNILASSEMDENGHISRYYPYDNLFAHVVGYSSKGGSGLERAESNRLLTSGENAVEQVKKNLKKEKTKGDSIVTSLNLDLQQAAYYAMGDRNGAVVVMKPSTGEILAMVSKPDFDPNSIDEIWDSLVGDSSNSNLLNRATQGLYPPGSTFKLVTTLSYLEQGNSLANFSFDCMGQVSHGGFTVHCYNNNAHGEENFKEAFAHSCNSAFAQIGVDLDRNQFKKTAEEVLFNDKLPLEIPYSKGRFDLKGSTPDALTMQTAIGQGDTVTSPFHMALITSAIANGGVLMKPMLVKAVENAQGERVKTMKAEEYKKLMTKDQADAIKDLMKAVVDQGTGAALSGQSYTAAGKTGTADHGDMSEEPHSWFVGFSNVDNPDIVVSVIAESAGTGSDVAVPIAKQIFDTYYSLS